MVTLGYSDLLDSEGFNYGQITQVAHLNNYPYSFIDIKILPTEDLSYLKVRTKRLLDFWFVEITQEGGNLYYSKNEIMEISYLNFPESIVVERMQLQFRYPFALLKPSIPYTFM